MGILDFFGISEEKGELKPLDSVTKKDIEKYIIRKRATKHTTQERRASNLRNADELRNEQLQKTQKNTVSEEGGNIVSDGVRYSLPSSEDRESLSKYADAYFMLGNPDGIIRKPVMRMDSPYMNFTDLLRYYINNSGMEHAEIYKRANLSKSVFSSLLTKKHIPKKGTIVALAIALGLDLCETERLLMKAGYTFSNTITGDLIAVYFINHEIYDIDKLNGALYEYGEPILGSKAY